MSKSSNKCRPTGNTVNSITYPCGETKNYITRPGSQKAEMMKRLHAKACKECDGAQGKLIATVLPTKAGNINRVTKGIMRDMMFSGSGMRIASRYGDQLLPAVHAYNKYITDGLEAAEDARRQSAEPCGFQFHCASRRTSASHLGEDEASGSLL